MYWGNWSKPVAKESFWVDSMEPTEPGIRARYGVDDYHRGEFTAAEHIIAYANLTGGKIAPHALIYALIASADEYKVVVSG